MEGPDPGTITGHLNNTNFTISFRLNSFSLGMLTKYTKLLIISTFLFSGLASPAFSQTQFAGWVGTFQNYKLSPRTGFYFDAQWRSTDQVRQMHALLLRPGLNLYFTPTFVGTVGYAYIPQQRISGGVEGYLPEHRIWEQLTYTHPVKTHHHEVARLTHRLRLEQRYLPKHHPENGQLVRDGHRNAHRLRYFARGIAPLAPTGGSFDKGWFAALQNEIFLNLGDALAVNGKVFDQNRAYIAAGYRMCKQFDVEVGYMNQYISGAGSNFTNNHIVQLATYVRL